MVEIGSWRYLVTFSSVFSLPTFGTCTMTKPNTFFFFFKPVKKRVKSIIDGFLKRLLGVLWIIKPLDFVLLLSFLGFSQHLIKWQ